jgi:hypothetical protein
MQYLENKGVDLEHRDVDGMTPLLYAMSDSDWLSTNFLTALVAVGADPNVVDLKGRGALHYAVLFVTAFKHHMAMDRKGTRTSTQAGFSGVGRALIRHTGNRSILPRKLLNAR